MESLISEPRKHNRKMVSNEQKPTFEACIIIFPYFSERVKKAKDHFERLIVYPKTYGGTIARIEPTKRTSFLTSSFRILSISIGRESVCKTKEMIRNSLQKQ